MRADAGCSDDALTSFSATTRRSGARRPAAMHELSSLLVAKFHLVAVGGVAQW